MEKQSLEFIKGLAKSEKNLYDEGIEYSIMTNPRNRNLYSVFGSEEKIVERILLCLGNMQKNKRSLRTTRFYFGK